VATSLNRALALLFALEDAPAGGLGVTQLAEAVGTHKSQVSRTLTALHESGLVRRDPETLGYTVGPRLLTLASRSSLALLVAAAQPLLKRLARDLGERVHLSVLQGDEVLTLHSESPRRALEATDWVGRAVPAQTTSAGRALLGEAERVVVDEEFEPGLVAAASPVRDAHGRIVAAINVSGPKFRLGPVLDQAAEAVQWAAAELSASV